jgi:MFS family permease
VLPFAGDALQIVLLAAAAGVATSFFRPAVYAGMPNVVADGDLPRANGLLQSAESITWAVGSIVGGALVAASGPALAYWVNAVTFVVSALLIYRIRACLETAERPASEGHWRDVAKGFRLVRESQTLMTVLVVWSVAILGLAGVNVAEVILAKEVLDAGDFGYGLMVGATGIGLTVGSLVGGGWIAERGVRGPYAVSIGLMAGSTAAAAVAPNVWIASACIVVSGFGNGIAVLCNALLVQRGAPDHLRGRVFTFVMSAGYAFLGVGMIIAGPLTNALGARQVWVIAAGLFVLAAATGWAMLGRARDAAGTGEVVEDEAYRPAGSEAL